MSLSLCCVLCVVVVLVVVVVVVVERRKREERRRRRETNRTIWSKFPSRLADSLRSVPQDKNGAEQPHQVKRMIGGIGNMLFSIYSQTLKLKKPKISLVNL